MVTFVKNKMRWHRVHRFFLGNARKFGIHRPERGITLVGMLTEGCSISKTFRDFAHSLKELGIPFQALDTMRFDELICYLGVEDRVARTNEYLSQRELYSLTNACDVYISLHRAEGFGLGIAEAMSMGKPVIVTNWSANTEFCKPDNSILVPFHFIRPTGGTKFDSLNNGAVSRWAEPDVDAAAAALRRLYHDRDECRRLGERAKKFMREYFSQESFKKSVDDFLDDGRVVP